MNFHLQLPLITPNALLQQLPITKDITRAILNARQVSKEIMCGNDNKLLVVVGPCSIHDPQAAIAYANLLKEAAAQFADELFIIMRVYFEKPRTTIGWKGLISDPYLDGSFDINYGFRLARQLLLDLNTLGIPTATEFLDTITPQYISDLISWGAIGARTSESQIHRELASGLMMPIGFKNSTDGNIKIAIDAVNTAKNPHHYLSINHDGVPAIFTTTGNHHCHIILRGSNTMPNYDERHVSKAMHMLKKRKSINAFND